jgi:phage/plasmid-like protein (TIGR03299 family)
MDRKTGTLTDGTVAADAAMFSVRETPWHKLGVIVDQALTAKEALVAAGLNYEVKTGPIFTPDMREIPTNIGQRVYRSDNDKDLGVVGARYTVIQNEDAFNILDYIIGNDDAKFETAGALGNGEVVWMNAKLQGDDITVAGDRIDPYFLLKNTHDGSGSLKLLLTPIRVVCQNTLNMAIGNPKQKDNSRRFTIKHTRNYDERVKLAKVALGFTQTYFKEFVSTAKALAAQKFTEKQFSELMDQLYPLPEKAGRGLTIAERERNKMWAAFNADDLNNIRNTKWGAYNAIADYADHGRESRGDNAEANAFIRTFEQTLMKDKAFELLTATK